MKQLLSLLRFGGVSALCMILNNLILIGADACGVAYGVATLLSYVIVVVVGYGLHTSYTFGVARSGTGFARYALAMAANVPAQWLLLWVLIGHLGLSMLAAAPFSTLAVAFFNFMVSRWAVSAPLLPAATGKESG